MMIARRLFDKCEHSTLQLTSVLPGVNTEHILALESTVFQLLNGNINISQSAYIQAHLNLRLLFKSVLYERQHRANLRPLHSRSEIVVAEKTKPCQPIRSKSVDSAHRCERGALYVLSWSSMMLCVCWLTLTSSNFLKSETSIILYTHHQHTNKK